MKEDLKGDTATGGGDTVVIDPQSIEPTLNDAACTIEKKKRVLHFSDGVVEEFSDEDEYQTDAAPAKLQDEALVDPKTLTWGPWVVNRTMAAGGTILKACDYIGESLASLFGITTPKYAYEIEEYNLTLKKEMKRKTKEDVEMAGWREEKNNPDKVSDAPTKSTDTAERLSLLMNPN